MSHLQSKLSLKVFGYVAFVHIYSKFKLNLELLNAYLLVTLMLKLVTNVMIHSHTKKIGFSLDFAFLENIPYHQTPSLQRENLKKDSSFGQQFFTWINFILPKSPKPPKSTNHIAPKNEPITPPCSILLSTGENLNTEGDVAKPNNQGIIVYSQRSKLKSVENFI